MVDKAEIEYVGQNPAILPVEMRSPRILLFLGYVASLAVFFFFQAEDGIRDVAVTGVQTCALPICSAAQAWGRTRRVSVDWRAGSVPLRRDAGALAKALGNVLSNAAEHGAGPIELRASRRSGDVLIEVTNPVSPAARKSVRGLRRERGRGLGIARRSAAVLGGELEFEAEPARVRTALVVPVDG